MKTIRIGTRDSELALWQAKTVQHQLEVLGYSTEIVSTKSHGDIELSKPLYEMGVTGIFTKALDIALLNGEIDIAVHSMKDVPTALPDGIVVGAVLKRGNPHDVLVYKGDLSFLDTEIATIATSSLRRKAQWLHRYPHHNIENLRGNVNTRLQKLADNPWNGAIFAAAGLERIDKLPATRLDASRSRTRGYNGHTTRGQRAITRCASAHSRWQYLCGNASGTRFPPCFRRRLYSTYRSFCSVRRTTKSVF